MTRIRKNISNVPSPVVYFLFGHFLIGVRQPAPTELLHRCDVHRAIVEVTRQPRHVLVNELTVLKNQCCGTGAGGAEIVLGPGAGAENIFL